jgi:hypothetical protein
MELNKTKHIMEFEIVEKETKRVKITLTPTRVTIKYPIGFTNRDKIESNVSKILEKQVITQSLRGSVDDNLSGVTVQNQSKTFKIRFDFI